MNKRSRTSPKHELIDPGVNVKMRVPWAARSTKRLSSVERATPRPVWIDGKAGQPAGARGLSSKLTTCGNPVRNAQGLISHAVPGAVGSRGAALPPPQPPGDTRFSPGCSLALAQLSLLHWVLKCWEKAGSGFLVRKGEMNGEFTGNSGKRQQNLCFR